MNQRQKSRLREGLRQLGPGLVTGAADDEPSGIATYSQAGAQFGFSMLWTVVFTLPLMVAIQLVSARIGYVTRRGLAANIKASFPRWVLLSVVGMLLARRKWKMRTRPRVKRRHQDKFDTSFDASRSTRSSAQAAEALRPLAGDFTFLLFSLGIIGTGMLAVPVLAGSAAYAVAKAVGWRGSLKLRLNHGEGRGFYAVVSAATVGGVILCFTPTDPVKELLWSAVINGVIAVPIMAVMMLLACRADIMGANVIGVRLRWLGWIATAVMATVVIAMLATF